MAQLRRLLIGRPAGLLIAGFVVILAIAIGATSPWAASRATTELPTRTPGPPRSVASSGTVYTVPTTIDGSGATDVTDELNRFVRDVPDGATIAFPAGRTYTISGQLLVDDRIGLTILGNGSTLRSVCADGAATDCSVFALLHSTGITVRNLVVTGNSPTPGVFDPERQGQIGFRIVAGGNIELDHVTTNDVFADGVDVDFWTDGVRVHDSTFNRSGRQGFVILAGRNIVVERNTYNGVSNSAGVFDLEPYQPSGGTSGFKFLDNTIAGYDFYFAANGGAGQEDIVVSGNRAVSGTIRAIVGKAGPRPQRVTITNNVSAGPAVSFDPETQGHAGIDLSHIDGLTVTGNTAAVAPSQPLAAIHDCTGVTYDGR